MRELGSFHPQEVAEEFIKIHGPFAHSGGLTYKFHAKPGIWSVVDKDALLRDIQAMNALRFYVKEERKDGSELTKYLLMAPRAQDEVLKAVLRHNFPDDGTFKPASGVAFANKYVAVEAGKLVIKDNAADNYAITASKITFDPTARAPKFLALLERLFARDFANVAQAKIQALKQFYGASLFGIAPGYMRSFILNGSGSNGKTTFMELMQDALFEGMAKSVAPARWDHEYYLAALHEVRLNTVSEIPDAEVFSSEIFKAVVTGDEVQGRHPAGRPFQFRAIAGHVFSANELPATTDVTDGFWRRFLVIDFTQKFADGATKQDIKSPILADEIPGILNWAVEGAIELIARGGYTTPSSHDEAMKGWKKDADAVLSFLGATSKQDGTWTAFSTIYAEYGQWTMLTGHAKMGANKFGRRLKSAGLERDARADTTYYKVRMKERRFWIDVIGGGDTELSLISEPNKEAESK